MGDLHEMNSLAMIEIVQRINKKISKLTSAAIMCTMPTTVVKNVYNADNSGAEVQEKENKKREK